MDDGMEHGTVEQWSDEEAWGVIASPATPGGCWADFSVVRMDGYVSLEVGTPVTFTFEVAEQDGYHYRATEVRPPGPLPARRVPERNDGAYRSTLRITLDDGTVLSADEVDELRRTMGGT